MAEVENTREKRRIRMEEIAVDALHAAKAVFKSDGLIPERHTHEEGVQYRLMIVQLAAALIHSEQNR